MSNKAIEQLLALATDLEGSHNESDHKRAAEALRWSAEEIKRLRDPGICYSPCERHRGMTFTMKVTPQPLPRSVCPICEPPT